MTEVNNEIDLFYTTAKGKAVSLALTSAVNDLLSYPITADKRVLIIGNADPFMPPCRNWLPEGAAFFTRYNDKTLPFSDCSFDVVLVVHALEHIGDESAFMREVWRITEEAGNAVFITPNRRSAWVSDGNTPFASGRPYSLTQLLQLINDSMFVSVGVRRALFLHPLIYGTYIAGREQKLTKILGFTAGAIIVKAEKTMYAGTPELTPELSLRKKLKQRLPNPTV